MLLAILVQHSDSILCGVPLGPVLTNNLDAEYDFPSYQTQPRCKILSNQTHTGATIKESQTHDCFSRAGQHRYSHHKEQNLTSIYCRKSLATVTYNLSIPTFSRPVSHRF